MRAGERSGWEVVDIIELGHFEADIRVEVIDPGGRSFEKVAVCASGSGRPRAEAQRRGGLFDLAR